MAIFHRGPPAKKPKPKRRKPKPKPKPPVPTGTTPPPPTQPGGGGTGGGGTTTTTSDTTTAGVTPLDTSGSPDLTSASTAAPAGAVVDGAADAADDNLAAFFSSGTGPALHYDPSQIQSQMGASGGNPG